MPETILEMVERHVEQGERLVGRQKEIVDLKRQRGVTTALSEDILQTLEAALALHREHLNRLQAW
jgi:hypothetical protein